MASVTQILRSIFLRDTTCQCPFTGQDRTTPHRIARPALELGMGSKRTPGFPLRVESLDVRMRYRTYKLIEYVGVGPEPTYRPWEEWIRTRILRHPPRWIPVSWPEIRWPRPDEVRR